MKDVPRKVLDAKEIISLEGKFSTQSPWLTIDQDMIDRFADVTDDNQFIHVDRQRAAQTPLGGTIAHGFLTLSLLSAMARDVLPAIREQTLNLNYGFDRVRFLAPVPSGARVRGLFRLACAEMRQEDQLLCRYDTEVQIEGAERPALVAQWYVMAILAKQ